jgi:hypothetical protein
VSWEQLRSIVRQNAQEQAFNASQPPQSCPNDGTPLQGAPDGTLFCQHDGYAWPRDGALQGDSGAI